MSVPIPDSESESNAHESLPSESPLTLQFYNLSGEILEDSKLHIYTLEQLTTTLRSGKSLLTAIGKLNGIELPWNLLTVLLQEQQDNDYTNEENYSIQEGSDIDDIEELYTLPIVSFNRDKNQNQSDSESHDSYSYTENFDWIKRYLGIDLDSSDQTKSLMENPDVKLYDVIQSTLLNTTVQTGQFRSKVLKQPVQQQQCQTSDSQSQSQTDNSNKSSMEQFILPLRLLIRSPFSFPIQDRILKYRLDIVYNGSLPLLLYDVQQPINKSRTKSKSSYASLYYKKTFYPLNRFITDENSIEIKFTTKQQASEWQIRHGNNKVKRGDVIETGEKVKIKFTYNDNESSDSTLSGTFQRDCEGPLDLTGYLDSIRLLTDAELEKIKSEEIDSSSSSNSTCSTLLQSILDEEIEKEWSSVVQLNRYSDADSKN